MQTRRRLIGRNQPGREPNGDGERRPASALPRGLTPGLWVWLGVLLVLLLLSNQWLGTQETISYSQFKAHLANGEVLRCVVSEHTISGEIASGVDGDPGTPEATPAPIRFRTTRVEDPKLVTELRTQGVEFSGEAPSVWGPLLLVLLFPIVLLVIFWAWVSKSLKGGQPGWMGFGKTTARITPQREHSVSFADVAGCDEAKMELQEVVEFLEDPERFRALGAKIPKGVLLVGPPGTGKTLLARAVAGQAKVPFFSLSGSEFVEMFVGVGAARVRDLFLRAKEAAPCIIFIDELDAVGRHRAMPSVGGNDEREQTLNQLLVELDGFEPNTGVILLAATNRPETLDRALLRPGRFDRQVVVDAPDLRGRESILRVHARGKPIDPAVDFEKVAKSTPGFSGADLANVMNEAALLAARRAATSIDEATVLEAVEKVVAGPERKSRRLSPEDKRRIAYHEAGHAVVAAHSEHADPVRKISIVPRGRAALGYTLQLPTGDQLLLARSALLDRVRTLLGGRASEAMFCEEVSTGAQNDLEQATALVRQMVVQYGMGESTGLMDCAPDPAVAGMGPLPQTLRCSDATAREIDQEVVGILDAAYREAEALLAEHREALVRVAEELLRRETLDEASFQELLARAPAVSAAARRV